MMQIVVVGGSIAGLVTALALARDGHRVVILEQDTTPLPESPDEAFLRWRRQGAPQVLHSHAFLARMHNLIRDREPKLLQELLRNGAEELTFRDQARQYFEAPEFEPGDDDLVLLACRRITFEWVLRRYTLATGLVEFRDGVRVTGLVAESQTGGPPVVRGVRIEGAGGASEEIAADLVVDASGRRTKLGDWLRAIGAPEPRVVSEPCGIFYSSRFYRLRADEARPIEDAIIGADFGYLKFGIFPGDAGCFSITLAAAPDDEPMRAVLRTPGFQRAAAAIPAAREWLARSEPIGRVHGMTNLRNTRRWLVENGEPLALGLVAVGDSLVHANPITGRGCTLAWCTAYALADAVRKHPDDPRAVALELNDTVDREFAPWLALQMRQDEDAVAVNEALRRGEDPWLVERPDGSTDERALIRNIVRHGLLPAVREDLGVMRALMRVAHMLAPPENLFERPEIRERSFAAYQRRHEREPLIVGPSRADMIELLVA